MAIRVRSDGTMVCAAHSKPEDGDTYIDDGLHYEMSVVKGAIVSLPMPDHLADPRWWWTAQAPSNADFWAIESNRITATAQKGEA